MARASAGGSLHRGVYRWSCPRVSGVGSGQPGRWRRVEDGNGIRTTGVEMTRTTIRVVRAALMCAVAATSGTITVPVSATAVASATAAPQADAGAHPSLSSTIASGQPRWAWPVSPVVVAKAYAAPPTPYAAGHRGIDLAVPLSAVVTAPAGATVRFAGLVVDRPVLTLDHGGGILSSYEPLVSDLPVGASVSTGQPLGRVAEGGHCASGCLHIGVRVDGAYVSPLLFFDRVPRAVLLPLRRPGGVTAREGTG